MDRVERNRRELAVARRVEFTGKQAVGSLRKVRRMGVSERGAMILCLGPGRREREPQAPIGYHCASRLDADPPALRGTDTYIATPDLMLAVSTPR
jgi:hypothetical protein